MATTTPLFGWSVPTSSDLVKNGATAIETLGDSIDASMGDLLGGTTGQVLSKTSDTDMDFTWATAAASSAANGTAFVATNETTTSTSYTGLTTALSTTVTTGTRALVIISAEIELAATSSRGYMSYAVSGATTIASSDAFSINIKTNADQTIDAHSYAYIVTGLTAGSNTFTTQYKSGQGNIIYFANRRISVIDMGS
jgi:hypothetical protein